jgi:hypothetical protein
MRMSGRIKSRSVSPVKQRTRANSAETKLPPVGAAVMHFLYIIRDVTFDV